MGLRPAAVLGPDRPVIATRRRAPSHAPRKSRHVARAGVRRRSRQQGYASTARGPHQPAARSARRGAPGSPRLAGPKRGRRPAAGDSLDPSLQDDAVPRQVRDGATGCARPPRELEQPARNRARPARGWPARRTARPGAAYTRQWRFVKLFSAMTRRQQKAPAWAGAGKQRGCSGVRLNASAAAFRRGNHRSRVASCGPASRLRRI